MSYLPNDNIPDGEILYRYCNPNAFPTDQDEIPLGIFRDRELSCDWEKFQKDPLSSFHISEGKTKVVAIHICEAIRNPVNPNRSTQKIPEWHQEIIYSPTSQDEDPNHEPNISHSLIIGLKRIPVQEAIAHNSSWYKTSTEIA